MIVFFQVTGRRIEWAEEETLVQRILKYLQE